MGTYLIGVATGVTVALIVAGMLWLIRAFTNEEKRGELLEAGKRRICRHEWEAIPNNLRSNAIFISKDRERCKKCGARR